jgi:hypothetical protein
MSSKTVFSSGYYYIGDLYNVSEMIYGKKSNIINHFKYYTRTGNGIFGGNDGIDYIVDSGELGIISYKDLDKDDFFINNLSKDELEYLKNKNDCVFVYKTNLNLEEIEVDNYNVKLILKDDVNTFLQNGYETIGSLYYFKYQIKVCIQDYTFHIKSKDKHIIIRT